MKPADGRIVGVSCLQLSSRCSVKTGSRESVVRNRLRVRVLLRAMKYFLLAPLLGLQTSR